MKHLKSSVSKFSPQNNTRPLPSTLGILLNLSIAAPIAERTASLVLLSFIFWAILYSCLSKLTTSGTGLPGGMYKDSRTVAGAFHFFNSLSKAFNSCLFKTYSSKTHP